MSNFLPGHGQTLSRAVTRLSSFNYGMDGRSSLARLIADVEEHIQQTGESARSLGRRAGFSESLIKSWLNGKVRSGRADSIAAIARAIHRDPADYLEKTLPPDFAESPSPKAAEEVALDAVPVYALTPQRSLAIGPRFERRQIDIFPRLPGIRAQRRVFGLYLPDSSMAPWGLAGDPVYISEDRPAATGAKVAAVFRSGGLDCLLIRQLIDETDTQITLRAFNAKPARAEQSFDLDEIAALWRVLEWRELLGVG